MVDDKYALKAAAVPEREREETAPAELAVTPEPESPLAVSVAPPPIDNSSVVAVEPAPRALEPSVIDPPEAAVPTEAGTVRAGSAVTVAAPVALDGVDTVIPVGRTVIVERLTVVPSAPVAVTVSW